MGGLARNSRSDYAYALARFVLIQNKNIFFEKIFENLVNLVLFSSGVVTLCVCFYLIFGVIGKLFLYTFLVLVYFSIKFQII